MTPDALAPPAPDAAVSDAGDGAAADAARGPDPEFLARLSELWCREAARCEATEALGSWLSRYHVGFALCHPGWPQAWYPRFVTLPPRLLVDFDPARGAELIRRLEAGPRCAELGLLMGFALHQDDLYLMQDVPGCPARDDGRCAYAEDELQTLCCDDRVCQRDERGRRDGRCVVGEAEGAACDRHLRCGAGLRCVSGACVRIRLPGEACRADSECVFAHFCGPSATCVPLPLFGEPCTAAGMCGVGACTAGVCSGDEGDWCIEDVIGCELAVNGTCEEDPLRRRVQTCDCLAPPLFGRSCAGELGCRGTSSARPSDGVCRPPGT